MKENTKEGERLVESTGEKSDGFAERLQYARDHNNLSQDALAQRIGVSRSTIANYEKGKGTPTPAKLDKLCSALNVSLAWLQRGEGAGPTLAQLITDTNTQSTAQHTRVEDEKPAPKPKNTAEEPLDSRRESVAPPTAGADLYKENMLEYLYERARRMQASEVGLVSRLIEALDMAYRRGVDEGYQAGYDAGFEDGKRRHKQCGKGRD